MSDGKTVRACAPRKRFKTQDACATACRNLAARRQVLKLPEPCSVCNGWHMGRPK